jgi:hypothetical protein
MTLLVKFIIALMGLVAAFFTLGAAVINSDDGGSDDSSIIYDDGFEDGYGNGYEDCVWDRSYDACGGSR